MSLKNNGRMDPDAVLKDVNQAESENVVGYINSLRDSTNPGKKKTRRTSKHKKTNKEHPETDGPENSNNNNSGLDFGEIDEKPVSKRSKSKKSYRSDNDNIGEVNDSMMQSGTSTNPTESIYTHSFHGKMETPQLQGPPPLKRTFLENSSESDSDNLRDMSADSHVRGIYKKPDWKFPVKRVMRNDDDQLYETLRERYSVKNIVSQLKRST